HLAEGQTLAILGTNEAVSRFAVDYELTVKPELEHFASLENEDESGFAEIIVPPTSPFIGKTLRDIGFRKNFRLEPLAIVGNDGTQTKLEEVPFEAGMQLVVYGSWKDLINLRNGREVAVLSDVKAPELAPQQNKKKPALFAIAVSLGLVFMGFPLSLSFFTGALLMILLGVIPKEEIYPAIDWKTVFLLAGLIPLGTAFEKSGAAAYTANAIVNLVGGWSTLAILFIIGLITMFFSLFMSNVAATVLLVPLVLMMADTFSMDPIGLALLVAVSASNSFILPTHQVNAFIMGPGGYRNADYMKAGGIMSLLFLIVSVLMVYVLFM
ncbi:MAG: SLC13 family permease, partial [Exiguobacterium mexicanum]